MLPNPSKDPFRTELRSAFCTSLSRAICIAKKTTARARRGKRAEPREGLRCCNKTKTTTTRSPAKFASPQQARVVGFGWTGDSEVSVRIITARFLGVFGHSRISGWKQAKQVSGLDSVHGNCDFLGDQGGSLYPPAFHLCSSCAELDLC